LVFSHNISEFIENQLAAITCIFGLTKNGPPKCKFDIQLPFVMYNVGNIMSYSCQAAINADSATYGFMMVATVSPLAYFFWMFYGGSYKNSLLHLWSIVSVVCILLGSIIWRLWEKKEEQKSLGFALK